MYLRKTGIQKRSTLREEVMARHARTIREFEDFQQLEEFQQAQDAAQQPTCTQLEPGRPRIRSMQVEMQGFEIALFEMSHRVKMETRVQSGESVLVLKLRPGMHANWNGQAFPAWGAALMRGGNEYEIVHERDFASIEFTFPDELLIHSGLLQPDTKPGQLMLSPREGQLYANTLGTLLRSVAPEATVPSRTHQLVMAAAAELLDRLDSASAQPVQEKPASNRISRAERLIEGRIQNPPDLTELASNLSVSPRTLRREFLKVLGVSPKAYILARRLEAAKRELRSGGMTTVADVSDKYGFSHPSRFAEHYRRQFGKRPSSTLRSFAH
jgi:AraC-like DNA-binding protein